MSAPLAIFLATVLIAVIGFLTRRRRVFAPVFTGISAALIGLLILLAPVDAPINLLGYSLKVAGSMEILGRTFELGAITRPMIGYLYLAGAFMISASWIAVAPRHFPCVAILILGVLAGSLAVEPFLYAAIFLEFAAMGAILVLVDREHPAELGALRILTLYTMAMMAILLGGWYLAIAGVSEATPLLAERVTILLGFGFAILLAIPPLHLWLSTISARAHPFILGFVAISLQAAGLFFLLRFLDAYPWMRANPMLFEVIRISGWITIVFGSLLAASQNDFRRFMAYSLLADLGVMMVAVGIGTPASIRLALGLSGIRVISLSVWSLSASRLEEETIGQQRFAGIGQKMPLVSVALFVGIFSLAGFPLTAGFPGRWALMNMLQSEGLWGSWVIVLAILLIVFRAFIWAREFFPASDDGSQKTLGRFESAYYVAGIGLCLLLGLFPQIVYPWVINIASGLNRLLP